MLSQVTLDRLRAEGFEPWAAGRWPQGRQELADLHASAVDGDFVQLAILTQVVGGRAPTANWRASAWAGAAISEGGVVLQFA